MLDVLFHQNELPYSLEFINEIRKIELLLELSLGDI